MELTVRSDSGREFQTKGPETQNAHSPSLERVLGTLAHAYIVYTHGKWLANYIVCLVTVLAVRQSVLELQD